MKIKELAQLFREAVKETLTLFTREDIPYTGMYPDGCYFIKYFDHLHRITFLDNVADFTVVKTINERNEMVEFSLEEVTVFQKHTVQVLTVDELELGKIYYKIQMTVDLFCAVGFEVNYDRLDVQHKSMESFHPLALYVSADEFDDYLDSMGQNKKCSSEYTLMNHITLGGKY